MWIHNGTNTDENPGFYSNIRIGIFNDVEKIAKAVIEDVNIKVGGENNRQL